VISSSDSGSTPSALVTIFAVLSFFVLLGLSLLRIDSGGQHT
jgi:hypothetical protein